MNDPYKILGVPRDADESVIKQAYRKLAKEWHPDRHRTATKEQQDTAAAKFLEIQSAYDDITKPKQKAPNYSDYANGPFRGGFSSMNMEDVLRDIETMFGGRSGFEFRAPPTIVRYSISLAEALTGKDAEFDVRFPNGAIQTVKIKIPPGVDSGWRVNCAGQGPQVNGKPTDLQVQLVVLRHDTFERQGEHLVGMIDITAFDAMVGADVDIKTLDGKTLSVKVPAGVQPGSHVRVVGQGMPVQGYSGYPATRGDLLLQIKVNIPKLTEEQIEKVKNFKNQL